MTGTDWVWVVYWAGYFVPVFIATPVLLTRRVEYGKLDPVLNSLMLLTGALGWLFWPVLIPFSPALAITWLILRNRKKREAREEREQKEKERQARAAREVNRLIDWHDRTRQDIRN